MNTNILRWLRLDLSRMETRLKKGKYTGLEQEYQDMWCLLNTRHFMECGMYYHDWKKSEEVV